MPNQNDEIKEISKLVDGGLFVDNLRKLEAKCNKPTNNIRVHPTVFFVLGTVFSELKLAWDDRPVETSEYNKVTIRLIPVLQSLLSAAENATSSELLLDQLDNTIREFTKVRLEIL